MVLEDLPATIARAKNVRGIAVYDPEAPPDREVFTWLSRKHQYRNVGFVPSLMGAHPDVDLDDYKTFLELGLPFESLAAFRNALEAEAPDWAIESVLVASVYVAPLFVHRPALNAFDGLSVWRLRSAADLPADQVMRHARIAGYGTLDFHGTVAERGYDAVCNGELEAERERRREEAAADGEERFWRLLGEEESGDTWVGGYVDLLGCLGEDARDVAASAPVTAMALGLVGGMAIDPPAGE